MCVCVYSFPNMFVCGITHWQILLHIVCLNGSFVFAIIPMLELLLGICLKDMFLCVNTLRLVSLGIFLRVMYPRLESIYYVIQEI